MLFIAATTFTLTHFPQTIKSTLRKLAARRSSGNRSVDLDQLVASTSTAARSPSRESSPATGTIAITTRFLRTRFVDHQRTAFDGQAVEFAYGLCRIIFRPEFNKSETLRSARVP